METYDKNIERSTELEELRRQVENLKYELGRSNIITQKVIRKSMEKSSSWLDSFVKAEVVTIPIFAIILGGFSWLFGTSILPVVAFVIMSVVSVLFDWRTMRIAAYNILTMSMSELRQSLQRQKKQRLIQTLIETPVAVGWLIWYVMSVKPVFHSGKIADDSIDMSVYILMGIAIVIALVVSAIVYFKAQATNDEMIRTIDTGE